MVNSRTKTAKDRRIGKSAGRKQPTTADDPDQATVEEFDREGLGVAPKE